MANEIKLSIVFDENGVVRGLEEVGARIRAMGNDAKVASKDIKTANENLKALQSSLQKEQAQLRQNQSSLPRNTVDMGSQMRDRAMLQSSIAESRQLINDNKVRLAAARNQTQAMMRELSTNLNAGIKDFLREYEQAFSNAIGNVGRNFAFKSFLKGDVVARAREQAKAVGDSARRGVEQILTGYKDAISELNKGFDVSKLISTFNVTAGGSSQNTLFKAVSAYVKLKQTFEKALNDPLLQKQLQMAAQMSAGTVPTANLGRILANPNQSKNYVPAYPKYSTNPSSPSFMGPIKPLDIKVANEGPIKASSSALMRWKEAALAASGAAKTAGGTMSGFTRALGSMNLNALFHGFLNIPNRISFAWWKLNNMFNLVTQGVNIVQGAFKGLTAGLMASNELFEMHRRLGYSINFLQQMSIAAKMTDSSLANLQVTLKNVSNSIGIAQKSAPTKERTAFQKVEDYLGPDDVEKTLGKGRTSIIQEIEKGALKGEEAIKLLLAALRKSREEYQNVGVEGLSTMQKLEMFTAIGGRGAFSTLVPVLEKMSDVDFDRVINQMGELGVLLGKTEDETRKNAQAAEKFRETWAQVANIPLGFITQFDIGAGPFFTIALEGFRDLVREMNLGGGGLKALGQTFGVAVVGMTDKVIERLRTLVLEFKTLGGKLALGNLVEDLGKLAGEAIPQLAAKILPAFVELGKRGAIGLMEGLQAAAKESFGASALIGGILGIAVGDIFEQLTRGTSAASFLGPLAPILGTALGGAITGALIGAISNAVSSGNLTQVGNQIGKIIGDGISGAVQAVISFVNFITENAGGALSAGLELGKAIVAGISQSLKENLGTNIQQVLGYALTIIGGGFLVKALFASEAVAGAIAAASSLGSAIGVSLSSGLVIGLTAGLAGLVFIFAGEVSKNAEVFQSAGAGSATAWVGGFMQVFREIFSDLLANLIATFTGISLIDAIFGTNIEQSIENFISRFIGAITYGLTGIDFDSALQEKWATEKDAADKAGYEAGKAYMENLEKQLKVDLQKESVPLGLVLNPDLNAEGLNQAKETMLEIQKAKQDQAKALFDLRKAMNEGDKASIESALDALDTKKNVVEDLVRQAAASKNFTSSIPATLEGDRAEAQDLEKQYELREKIALSVQAGTVAMKALAEAGTHDIAIDLANGEAAAIGLGKGLRDAAVDAQLLTNAIQKAVIAIANSQVSADNQLDNEEARLALMQKELEAGKSLAQAKAEADFYSKSNLPKLQDEASKAWNLPEGPDKDAAIAAIKELTAEENRLAQRRRDNNVLEQQLEDKYTKHSNKAANAQKTLNDELAAALLISHAISDSEGFDDLAVSLIKAEAAARGLKKGLQETAENKDALLFIGLTKLTDKASDDQNKRARDIELDKQRLDYIDQLVDSGVEFADAEERASAIKSSQIPLYEQALDAAAKISDEALREQKISEISVSLARERSLVEDDLNQKIRERNAVSLAAAKEEVKSAQKSYDIAQRRASGQISSDEARVAEAAKDAISEEEAAAKRLGEAIKIATENASRGFIDMAETLKSSLGQIWDGVLDGTKNFSDIFADIGKQWGRQLFEGILDEKIGFDGKVKVNFLGLASYATDAFGGIFDAVGLDGVASKLKGIPSLFGELFGTADYKSSEEYINKLANGSGASDSISGLFGAGSSIVQNIYSGVGSLGYTGETALTGLNLNVGPQPGAGQGYGVLLDSKAPEIGTTGKNVPAKSGISFADIAAGAVGGFETATALNPYIFKKGATGLNGLAAGAESGIFSNARVINSVIGTAVGALLSTVLGPLGGMVGGAVSSAIGAMVMGSIDRNALRNRRFNGGLGGGIQDFEKIFFGEALGGIAPSSVIFSLLGIPTLGTAMRRGGEGLLDASKIFGNEGLQGSLGDWIRDSGTVSLGRGKSEKIDDNYRTGSATALSRGMTQDQIDQILGSTTSIFSQLAADEKFPQDAGRLAEDMGQSMAEFLSRGLSQGMKFDELFASLREFAKESGITLESSLKGLDMTRKQSEAAGLTFGKLSPDVANEQGLDAYVESLKGITDLFADDYPKGVNIAALALQSFEKDGVKAFDGLEGQQTDFYTKLAGDTENFSKVVKDLLSQGYQLDTDEIMNRIEDVSASAKAVRESMGSLLSGDNAKLAVSQFSQAVRDSVANTAQETLFDQLMSTTNIGGSFEKAFGLIRELGDGKFDLTTSTGVESFGAALESAISEGRTNLESYLPTLEKIREVWEEAFKPKTLEEFFIALEAHIAETQAALQQAVGESVNTQIFEASGPNEALRNVGSTLREQVRQNIQAGISAAITQSVFLSPALATALEQWKVTFAAAMKDGLTESEIADLKNIGGDINRAVQGVMTTLRPVVEEIFSLVRDGAQTVKEAIDQINQSFREMLTQSGNSLLSSLSLEKANPEKSFNAFAASFREQIRDAVLSGMIAAFTESAIISGMLGPLMHALSQAFQTAMADGVITASESADLKQKGAALAGGVGQALDFLRPVVEALAQFGIDLYALLPGSEALDDKGNPKGGNTPNYAPSRNDKNGGMHKGSEDYDRYAALNDTKKEIFRMLVEDEGKSFDQAFEYIKNFSKATDAMGIRTNKAFESVAELAAKLGLTFSETADLLKDSAIVYNEAQQNVIADLVNNQDYTVPEAAKRVDLVSEVIKNAGLDYASSFATITNLAETAGISWLEAAYAWVANIREVTSSTKKTFTDLTPEQQKVGIQAFGIDEVGDKSEKIDTFYNSIEKAGLDVGDAMTYLSYIAEARGISLAEAMDFFINWVATGGKAGQDLAAQQQAQLEAAKATTAAWATDLANAGTGTEAQRAAALSAEQEYIEGRRAAGATEQQIQTELATQYQKAGGDLETLTNNLATLNLEMQKPAATQLNDAMSNAAITAGTLDTALSNLTTAFENAATRLNDVNVNSNNSSDGGGGSGGGGEKTPAAASGGVFANSAVVGEAGKPELVTALSGGGFEVTPLEWDEAQRLMNGDVDAFKRGGCKGGGCTKGCGAGCKVRGMKDGGIMGCNAGCSVPGLATGGYVPPRTRGGGTYRPPTACGMKIDGVGGWYPAAGGKKDEGGLDERCGTALEWKEWAPNKWAAKVSNPKGCCSASRDGEARQTRDQKNGSGSDKPESMFGSVFSSVFDSAVEKAYNIKPASFYKTKEEREKDAAGGGDGGGGGGGGSEGGSGSGSSKDYCPRTGDPDSPGRCRVTGQACGWREDCTSDPDSPNQCRLPDTGCAGSGRLVRDPDGNAPSRGDGPDGGGGTRPGDPTKLDPTKRGAATGGTFNNAAVVGEAGKPELVEALPGGGFRVTPLSWDEADKLLNGGVAGFAEGGTIGGGNGPTTMPDEAVPAPLNLFGDAAGAAKSFADEFVKGLQDAIPSGFADAIKSAFENSDAVKAMNDGIDSIMDEASQVTSDMLAGKMTPEEAAAKLEELGNKANSEIEKVRAQAAMLDPLFAKIAKDRALTFDIDISSALKDAAKSGDMNALGDALKENIYDSVLDGVIQAMLASGPLKDAIDGLNKDLSEAMKTAMEDGMLDASEADLIGGLAETFGGQVEEIMTMLQPFFDKLGVNLSGSTKNAIGDAVSVGKTILGNALNQWLSPDRDKAVSLGQILKQETQNALKSAMITAFVDAAIASAAVAPILAAIGTLIGEWIDAILNGADKKADHILRKIDRKIKKLGEAWLILEPIIEEFTSGIGDLFGDEIGGFAGAVDSGTSDIQDSLANNCDGQCDLDRTLYEQKLGLAELNQLGREGTITGESYVPRGSVPGGTGGFGGFGGQYGAGTKDWSQNYGFGNAYFDGNTGDDLDTWGRRAAGLTEQLRVNGGKMSTSEFWVHFQNLLDEFKDRFPDQALPYFDGNQIIVPGAHGFAGQNSYAMNHSTLQGLFNTWLLQQGPIRWSGDDYMDYVANDYQMPPNMVQILEAYRGRLVGLFQMPGLRDGPLAIQMLTEGRPVQDVLDMLGLILPSNPDDPYTPVVSDEDYFGRQFAEGGVATRATRGLFGEAGPEAILPLSSRSTMRMIGNAILDGLNLGDNITNVGDLIRAGSSTGLISPNSTRNNPSNEETNSLLRELIAAVKDNGNVSFELGDEKFMRGFKKATRSTTKAGRKVY